MSKYLNIATKFQRTGEDSFDEQQKTEIKQTLWRTKSFAEYVKTTTNWTYDDHDKLVTLLDVPKNNFGYYKDIYDQRVSYNGIRTLRNENVKFPVTSIHRKEMEKCADDFEYFRKYYIKIITRKGLARPEPREYQEDLEQGLVSLEDVVVLFPRQSGKTVTSGIYLLWRAMFHVDPINIGIVANKRSTAIEVLDKIKKIFIELPIWMQRGISIWNKGSIEFENGTRIMTDGPSSDSFRGYSINIVYLDEIAYFKKSLWDEFSDAVFPTMNSLIFKQVIMTSTANGMNHFEHIVKQAKRKDTPEKYITTSWKNVPHYSKTGRLYKNSEYKKLTVQKFGKKFFAQTEENAFLGSSDTLISSEALREIEESSSKIELIPHNILNQLNVVELAEPGRSYIISVDPSKDGIDDFAVNVTDISQFPFKQVAWANLQIDYLVMPDHLNELGKYYNNGLIIVENNEGSGQSITDTLWGVYEYENLYRDKNIEGRMGFKRYTGFRTTQKSRPLILNLLKIFIDEGKLIVNSEETLQQLYTFTKRKTGNKYEAEDGYKDDAVMSLAMIFAPFMSNKTFDNYLLFVKELKKDDSVQHTKDYISTLDIGFSEDSIDEEQDRINAQRKAFIESGVSGFSGDDYGIAVSGL